MKSIKYLLLYFCLFFISSHSLFAQTTWVNQRKTYQNLFIEQDEQLTLVLYAYNELGELVPDTTHYKMVKEYAIENYSDFQVFIIKRLDQQHKRIYQALVLQKTGCKSFKLEISSLQNRLTEAKLTKLKKNLKTKIPDAHNATLLDLLIISTKHAGFTFIQK